MTGRFTGKVALVTGAASGIGLAVCRRLVAEGATVVGADIARDPLAELVGELGSAFSPYVLDIADREACFSAVASTVAGHGRLDVLGNVAGFTQSKHAVDYSEEEYRRLMAVCADGAFFLAQAALPHLVESSGSLVNVASNSGVQGVPYVVPYSMAKGAIVAMTRSLAVEYAKTGVRINAIAPAGTLTGIVRTFSRPDDVDPELAGRTQGFRGINTAEEVAAFFAFVASDEAPGIHGAILTIDRGVTAG
ncbi:MAG TPA: SDR family oxidoreductase [Nocardioides sp.]|nr:SDR family oxidoreductase [Nocardioides sp.]